MPCPEAFQAFGDIAASSCKNSAWEPGKKGESGVKGSTGPRSTDVQTPAEIMGETIIIETKVFQSAEGDGMSPEPKV